MPAQRPSLETFPFPLVSVSGGLAEQTLAEMRKNAAPGTMPVIVGDAESVRIMVDMLEINGDVPAETQLLAAEAFDVEGWIAECREDYENEVEDDNWQEIHEGGTEPIHQILSILKPNGKPLEEVFIASVPSDDNSALPVWLGFGGSNDCPPAETHVAMARYWREKFGARISAVTYSTIEFNVTRLPKDEAEALELAWEHFFYCSDIVDQGVGSVATLAQALRHSTVWYFWWD